MGPRFRIVLSEMMPRLAIVAATVASGCAGSGVDGSHDSGSVDGSPVPDTTSILDVVDDFADVDESSDARDAMADAPLGPTIQLELEEGITPTALSEDGAVRAWGFNGTDDLGYATTVRCGPTDPNTCSATPTVVPGLGRVTQVAPGNAHTCVLVQDGTVQCWGWAEEGQLGDGSTSPRLTPGP